MKSALSTLRELARNTPNTAGLRDRLAVATKVLPARIFAHHLGIILMKFELIRYVVKEERLCGTTRKKDGLHFASTEVRITWNAPRVISQSANLQLA